MGGGREEEREEWKIKGEKEGRRKEEGRKEEGRKKEGRKKEGGLGSVLLVAAENEN